MALDRAIPEAVEARRRAFERWWEVVLGTPVAGLIALETALLKWAANDYRDLTEAETKALVRFQEALEGAGLHIPVVNDDREIRGLVGGPTSPVFLAWAWARRGSVYDEIHEKVGKDSRKVGLALRLLRWWRRGGTTETFLAQNPDLSVEEVGEVERALLGSDEVSFEEWMYKEYDEEEGYTTYEDYTYEEYVEERAQREALAEALEILGLTPEEALRPDLLPKVRELTIALYS